MARPSRSKKQINYAEFDDDEDFACVKAPPSKKARVSVKELEHKSAKPESRTASQEDGAPPTGCKERRSLDDKLYERDLEAALTLSMLRTEAVEELSPNDKGERNQPLTDTKTAAPSPLLSNCSVDISLLGLDKISDERGSPSAPSRQRQAASKASEQQRRMLQEERDSTTENARDEDYQPTCTPDAESESDADFDGEDESEEEEFTVKKKVERKKPTKKEKTTRPPAPKKEKKPSKVPKSKLQATVTSTLSPSPAPAKSAVTKRPATSSPVSRPAVSLSPAGGRLPKWNPPAQIGRSPSTSQPLQVKSPGQGLRLGLSRLARVKPLHPSAVSH
ncbi:hypothetical protein MATL_G00246810 [Megalops atlanticus]|uniref:RAD51 interacting motif domain-containing protein n=1 Tax=Megalops atlanticus TaxID=7932 RepID=A0A9D3T0G9_MEGAT|nr:hypothetical protein MATL_G00246810 [Megalops atlanticus]